MSHPEKVDDDMSMDEILASIRRIISAETKSEVKKDVNGFLSKEEYETIPFPTPSLPTLPQLTIPEPDLKSSTDSVKEPVKPFLSAVRATLYGFPKEGRGEFSSAPPVFENVTAILTAPSIEIQSETQVTPQIFTQEQLSPIAGKEQPKETLSDFPEEVTVELSSDAPIFENVTPLPDVPNIEIYNETQETPQTVIPEYSSSVSEKETPKETLSDFPKEVTVELSSGTSVFENVAPLPAAQSIEAQNTAQVTLQMVVPEHSSPVAEKEKPKETLYVFSKESTVELSSAPSVLNNVTSILANPTLSVHNTTRVIQETIMPEHTSPVVEKRILYSFPKEVNVEPSSTSTIFQNATSFLTAPIISVQKTTQIIPEKPIPKHVISAVVEKETPTTIPPIPSSMPSLDMGNQNSQLQAFIYELIQPLLKDWVNAYLPSLIEKAVEQEVTKMFQKLREP